ncbi:MULTISPECIES: extensin family protein [Shimia]|uniref:extensin-like domain-containing protein n=1 Tax=Shimia TaxID=573139 RepID=UPI001FB1A995|nr:MULTISPECIES: extensin family protein [Shimia]MDV4145881.1 extensin family protein [Shimia sp. FJ5]
MTGRAGGIALVLALLIAEVAVAQAPNRSPRPVLREDTYPIALPSHAPRQSLRPVLRTHNVARNAAVSVRPAVVRPTPKGAVPQSAVGKVCRDRDLQGIVVGHVPGKISGCGIAKDAVKIYSVSGIAFSQPAVMRCDTARAIKSWLEGGMARSVGRYGGGVEKVKVAAGYSCRTRNHKKGAKISEHGKGNAIDFSAFYLANGDEISVLRDWGKGKKGRILRDMHRSACGPFGTVLGPESDRYHKDHFHFDIARYRSGPYCR